jgi:hypothetical protein
MMGDCSTKRKLTFLALNEAGAKALEVAKADNRATAFTNPFDTIVYS